MPIAKVVGSASEAVDGELEAGALAVLVALDQPLMPSWPFVAKSASSLRPM